MELKAFGIGFTLGALSWVVVPMVSNNFEPFDSGIGFLIGQVTMSAGAIYFSYSKGIKNIIFYMLGIYIGQNLYAYVFGPPGTRSWALLLLITSIALCVFPLITAGISKIVYVYSAKTK